VVFKSSPAALNGVVFAVIRRIVNQNDLQVVFVREFDQALHELGSVTGILRTIVQVDDSLFDMAIMCLVSLPPLFQAIDDEVAGFRGGPKENGKPSCDHIQNTEGN